MKTLEQKAKEYYNSNVYYNASCMNHFINGYKQAQQDIITELENTHSLSKKIIELKEIK